MKLYKILNPDRTVCHGGTGAWPEPGTWLRVEGEIIPCESGLHLCEARDLIHWIGLALWEVELDPNGDAIRHDDCKWVVSGARLVRRVEKWNDCNLRHFACDCAERALLREREDGREPHPASWEALRVARRCVDGLASEADLTAAWAAARDAGAATWAAARAAGAAAGAAAEAAAEAAEAAGVAAGAAGAAAGAAWAAARDAERDWQARRLIALCVG